MVDIENTEENLEISNIKTEIENKEIEALESHLDGPETSEDVEIEKLARQMGWRPKQDLEPGKAFVAAGEYVRRGPLIEEISKRGKEIKRLESAYEELASTIKNLQTHSLEKERSSLDSRFSQAVLEGNEDEARKIVEERDKLRILEPREVSQQSPAQLPAGTQEFLERNPWFLKEDSMSTAMRTFAIVEEQRVINGGMPQADAYKYVEDRVKAVFPDMFKNHESNDLMLPAGKVSAVESATPLPRKSKKTLSIHDLTPPQKKVFNDLVKRGTIGKDGVMTESEYFQSLANS